MKRTFALLLSPLPGCSQSADNQTDPDRTDLSALDLVNAACVASGRDEALELEFLSEYKVGNGTV